MLASDTMRVAVMAVDGAMVASATLIVAPNLLRGGRSHGFLENVAVHPDWQGKGNGRVIIRFLLDLAWGATAVMSCCKAVAPTRTYIGSTQNSAS